MTSVVDSIRRAAASVPEWAIISWPGPVGRRVRAAYWKARLGGMGRRCTIDVGVIIQSPESVFLGDDVWLDNYAVLIAGAHTGKVRSRRMLPSAAFGGVVGQIRIGDRCHIGVHTVVQGHGGVLLGADAALGAHTMLYSQTEHYCCDDYDPDPDDYASVPKYAGSGDQMCLVSGPIEIGAGAAVLGGSMVLPGSAVGRFTVIGAGSLVQGRVAPGVIATGNPLRVVKQRFGRPLPA